MKPDPVDLEYAAPPAQGDFAEAPSRPRAPAPLRILVFLVMLALAMGAIWWIDRGVALTNSHL